MTKIDICQTAEKYEKVRIQNEARSKNKALPF